MLSKGKYTHLNKENRKGCLASNLPRIQNNENIKYKANYRTRMTV